MALSTGTKNINTAVFISGTGSNLKSLIKFSKLKNKSNLESVEDIEILRFLEIGLDVHMLKMSSKSVSVDTLQDLKKVEKILNS